MDEPDDYEFKMVPPTPQQVAERAIILAVVAYRGILENSPHEGAAGFWEELRGWFYSLNLEPLLEPDEAAVLDAPLGTLTDQQAINASWRTEGAAVLTWALRRYALPPHDTSSDIDDLIAGLGFAELPENTALANPQLREPGELEHYNSVALTLHWRLRQYGIKPEAMNFVAFVQGAEWGPLTLKGTPLLHNDLAIGSAAIYDADPQHLRLAQSIAMERHQAANWLLGWHPTYSEVDTST